MSKLIGILLLSVSLFTAAAASAQSRTIAADFTKPAGPHSATPLMTVGAGRANEGLRADWQQQLATVQKEIGFKYIRFHGLLSRRYGRLLRRPERRPSIQLPIH